ncbi:16S rRNA (guanine(966)-N(2))-methyltransferase RsmD [Teredinibacter franksiae]|uniref:16S rRNA (guanine(966)-N(2))-methyltransferase RsmD n=1 Tax=Teredinibacter franksiae TaxID=2761453 RepID=UPI001625635F|nr:16S rRNA (guanine(966)-N(2))-methyltransferase RsmD [Teredinibacter franksiae]
MPSKKKKPQKPSESSIRIIGGQWRGRKLAVTEAEGLRPTADRVRETLFNWLMADIHGSRCLDLFAGTGALGLEALSRGAAFVQFAETNTQAARQLEANLQLLDGMHAKVFGGDGLSLAPPSEPFDLVFLDPPYARNLWQPALTYLAGKGLLHPSAKIYIEAPKSHPSFAIEGLYTLKEKTAGSVRYGLYTKTWD